MRREIVGAALVVAGVLGPMGTAEAQSFALQLRAELVVQTPEGTNEPLPLIGERLRIEIDAQHATTTMRQVFRNQTTGQLEGRYVLRPTLAARVTAFAYYIGEERIVGEVIERTAANQVYEAVTTARRDPAILEQTADGEFTFRVFPIQPAEDKRIEITFSEWLVRRGNTVTYRVPIGSPAAEAEVTIRDPRARDVRSPTHSITVEQLPGGGLRVRTRGVITFRGELELRYRIEEPAWSLSAYLHHDPGHAAYFALSVASPPGLENAVSPKDVTLVLDRSGSMAGAAIVNAQRAAMDVVARLGPADRLNVIAFDDDVDPLWVAPRPADATTRAEATAFLSRLTAGGGTDIAFALRRGLDAQHDEGGRPRVIILLTDGQSAAEPVLELAANDQRDVRVFTVGIGEGVNRALLSRLAADKRGRFTHIAHAAQIEAEVGHLYAQVARPLLVDVSLEVEGDAVASRLYPRSLPDLFIDDELSVLGRLRGEGHVSFVVRGRVGNRAVELRAALDVPAGGVSRPWVGRRWAIARVDDLLEEMALKGERAEMRDEVISLALAYDFVTPYTAFLAIPEREVNAQAAEILARARGERSAAQARHADAVALASPPGMAGAQAHFQLDAMQARVSAEGSFANASPPEPMPASDSGGDAEMDVASRAGCASCTVASPRERPWGLAGGGLIVALLVVRRARRGRAR